MGRSVRTGIAIALTSMLPMLTFVPSASAGQVTVTPVEVDAMVGPERDVRCRIVADLYVPPGASQEDPQPAILTTHGFGGSKESQAGLARAFAEKGYVVLAYSGLGFGGSDCKIHLDHPDWDGRAASRLVDYLAGLDIVELDADGDPRVGMFGGSYGGGVQFAAAAVDDRIDAIVPAVTWNDLSYALGPNNAGLDGTTSTAEPGVLKRFWTDLFAVFGILRGLEHAPGDPRRLIGCPNFADWVCPTLIEANVTGYVDEKAIARLREVSVASYASNVRAPTLILQGQDDTLFNLQEAAATYRALRDQGTPVRMIWHK
ncbi:MAG TPA: alpha/beta fold hydrolase, partial [Actinopolymorphaceae bacterium]